jgi:hypothetical protein
MFAVRCSIAVFGRISARCITSSGFSAPRRAWEHGYSRIETPKNAAAWAHPWRIQGEHDILAVMPSDDRPMTEQELEQLRQNVARLSEDGLKRFYQQAWKDCEIRGDRLPAAKAVQQLVQAWKQLWKWRQPS